MKKEFYLSIGLMLFNLIACSQTDVSNEREWTELKCGLYINSKGDLGFPTEPDIVFIPSSELEGERSMCPNNFLTKFGYNDTLQLKNVIDINSFESLGAGFYKDKGHVYSHYAVCAAGYFHIFADDTTTFKVLGGYAIYKTKVYERRKGLIEADAATFKVFEGFDHIAKDKDGFLSFGERISEEELKNEMGEGLFNKLVE
jgi:hypothetical protein